MMKKLTILGAAFVMIASMVHAEKVKGIAWRTGENTFICYKSKYATCVQTVNPDDRLGSGARVLIYFYDENRPTVAILQNVHNTSNDEGEESVEYEYFELEEEIK